MASVPAPLFTFLFPGLIWRILPDEQDPTLILEIREKTSPKVTFVSIDAQTGDFLWQNTTLAPTPWTTAVGLSAGILFLQSYTQSTPPQIIGLLAYDIHNQELLWERPKAAYRHAYRQQVVVKENEFEKIQYYQLDSLSGEVLRNVTGPEELASAAQTGTTVLYPVSYTESNPYWQVVAVFLENTLRVLPVNVVEYAETGSRVVISYYLYQVDQYDNWLAVFDQSGELEWQVKIGSALPGTGNNTFLITNNRLIFVKEKNQVLGYVL